jgi:hypothetical protein
MDAVAQRSGGPSREVSVLIVAGAFAEAAAGPAAAFQAAWDAVVAPDLQQVVGGRDQPPFRVAGGSASALEAVDLAVELGVAEDRSIIAGRFRSSSAPVGVASTRRMNA